MNEYRQIFNEVLTRPEKTSAQLIMEGGNTPIIVIDVQPAYDKWCGKIMPALTNFLNKSHGPVLCFFNDPEVGGNVEHEVVDYYLENGIEDDRLNSIDFRPKTYAFFRGWMDAGMERKFIIKAIRYMVMNDIRDSREITTKEWEKIFTDVGAKDFELDDLLRIVEDEPLFVPDISISELKRFSGCYLCGGAKDQCLSEFRFLLEAFNIRYKLVNSLIY